MSLTCSFPLADLITEICERAGLPATHIDVSDLSGYLVMGLAVTSEHSAFTYIRSLAEAYFFDPSNYGGKVVFRKRGGEVLATINHDDLLEDLEDDEIHTRKDSLAVPKRINMSYYDLMGGLSPDMQYSERVHISRSLTETRVDTPLIMTFVFAKDVVVKSHKIAVEEQRGDFLFRLPDSYLRLTVGDVVNYRDYRLRLNEVKIDDGFQEYKASFDRQSIYTGFNKGATPPSIPAPGIDNRPGMALIEVLDIPILADRDDQLGVYLALAGTTPYWRGAVVDVSFDGGATYVGAQVSPVDSVIGTLQTTLPAHAADTPDEVNSARVRLYSYGDALEPTTLPGMLNRVNRALIGDEIVSFADAEEVEPGVWELGHFLRGRKQTAAVAHEPGERFVLLDRTTLGFLPAELVDLGKEVVFRAVTLNSTTTSYTTLTFTGQSQTEFRPAYLTAYRDGDEVVIGWQGVGRLGGGAHVAMGAYFAGYRITVGTTVYDQLGTGLTAPIPPEPTTITVQQRNALTGPGPFIEVTI